jgi:aminobenzoyl-glutamate utilization protein B
MAQATYRNLVEAGAPQWRGPALDAARAIQKELGLEPMEEPFLPAIESLVAPEAAEARLRAALPAWQTHFTSDDYTEMTWHAPTARFYVGRPALRAPDGFAYPDWAMNALGGMAEMIDPMIEAAAKTIAGTMIDLITDESLLAAARAEFVARTGGGMGGAQWLAPLCDYSPPIDFPWPRYIETGKGREWWIPETEADRELHR